MALGTVIGSNFFNFLGVIGIAAMISPFAIDADVYHSRSSLDSRPDHPFVASRPLWIKRNAQPITRNPFDSPIRKLSLAYHCNDRAELMSFIKSAKRTIRLESEAIAQISRATEP